MQIGEHVFVKKCEYKIRRSTFMVSLSFSEQIKIVLGRKNMTIKELAEIVEKNTGKKMSRQNLTQRLNRDNFQERDMRIIAEILGCEFRLDIIDNSTSEETIEPTLQELQKVSKKRGQKAHIIDSKEQDITLGDFAAMLEDGPKNLVKEENVEVNLGCTQEFPSPTEANIQVEVKRQEGERAQAKAAYAKEQFAKKMKPVAGTKKIEPSAAPIAEAEENLELGEENPYTGHEYQTNSVRVHPNRIGYVQVYDRGEHKWTDMTEWAFLGYQERKKVILGKDYEQPIYLD